MLILRYGVYSIKLFKKTEALPIPMPDFEKKEFLEFALEQHVFDIPLQAVELRSGGKSKWYISWRGVAGRVVTRRMLCAYILDFMKDQGIEPDSVLGVPVGATGIADRVQERLSAYRKGDNRVLAVGRKEPKIGIASPYNWFVQPPEGMTLVLEDTGTGFNSAMDWVERVNTLDNARVRWALAITDREQFGRYGQSGGRSEERR